LGRPRRHGDRVDDVLQRQIHGLHRPERLLLQHQGKAGGLRRSIAQGALAFLVDGDTREEECDSCDGDHAEPRYPR
jgi:hypothetical protein